MPHEGNLFACSPALGKLVIQLIQITKLALRPVTSPFSDIYYYHEIPKISPGAYFWRGLYSEEKFAFQNRLG